MSCWPGLTASPPRVCWRLYSEKSGQSCLCLPAPLTHVSNFVNLVFHCPPPPALWSPSAGRIGSLSKPTGSQRGGGSARPFPARRRALAALGLVNRRAEQLGRHGEAVLTLSSGSDPPSDQIHKQGLSRGGLRQHLVKTVGPAGVSELGWRGLSRPRGGPQPVRTGGQWSRGEGPLPRVPRPPTTPVPHTGRGHGGCL